LSCSVELSTPALFRLEAGKLQFQILNIYDSFISVMFFSGIIVCPGAFILIFVVTAQIERERHNFHSSQAESPSLS